MESLGKKKKKKKSKPVLAMIGNKIVQGRFVLVEDSSVCLLGREPLQVLDVELHKE